MTAGEKSDESYDDGKEAGMQKGIQGAVEMLRKLGRKDQEIMKDISDQYSLSDKQAKKYLE